MHSFSELVERCTEFTLEGLGAANERTIAALQTSSTTSLVKTLQMIQLQKAILAVGMFSLFEAGLQDGLKCGDGFGKATDILDHEKELALKERFSEVLLAINVLKHGRGRSYDALVAKKRMLPFRVKLLEENFFFEGDVTEVSTLIDVDDSFVKCCAQMIGEVSEVIRKSQP